MNIQLEILEANYWEHFKFAKDLAQFLSINNPNRIRIEKQLDEIIKEIHELKR